MYTELLHSVPHGVLASSVCSVSVTAAQPDGHRGGRRVTASTRAEVSEGTLSSDRLGPANPGVQRTSQPCLT